MHWKTGVSCKPTPGDLDIPEERLSSDSCEIEANHHKEGNKTSHFIPTERSEGRMFRNSIEDRGKIKFCVSFTTISS